MIPPHIKTVQPNPWDEEDMPEDPCPVCEAEPDECCCDHDPYNPEADLPEDDDA